MIAAVEVFLACGLWDIPRVRAYGSVLGMIALGLVAVRVQGPVVTDVVPGIPGVPGRARSIPG